MDSLVAVAMETGCKRLFIITAEIEEEVVWEGKTVKVLPTWKWMLEKVEF